MLDPVISTRCTAGVVCASTGAATLSRAMARTIDLSFMFLTPAASAACNSVVDPRCRAGAR